MDPPSDTIVTNKNMVACMILRHHNGVRSEMISGFTAVVLCFQSLPDLVENFVIYSNQKLTISMGYLLAYISRCMSK